MTNPDEILNEMAETFKLKKKEYGNSYKIVGGVMAAMFPDGIELKTAADFELFSLFDMKIVKLTRFAETNLNHTDSVHDDAIYGAMIESILAERNRETEREKNDEEVFGVTADESPLTKRPTSETNRIIKEMRETSERMGAALGGKGCQSEVARHFMSQPIVGDEFILSDYKGPPGTVGWIVVAIRNDEADLLAVDSDYNILAVGCHRKEYLLGHANHRIGSNKAKYIKFTEGVGAEELPEYPDFGIVKPGNVYLAGAKDTSNKLYAWVIIAICRGVANLLGIDRSGNILSSNLKTVEEFYDYQFLGHCEKFLSQKILIKEK